MRLTRRTDREDRAAATLLITLRNLDLLRDASRSTLYEIADAIVDISTAPGTVVVREGDDSEALYVLVSGTVEVTGHGPDGPVRLRTMTAPSYFGEIGVLRGVRRTATVTALSSIELWQIPAEFFAAAVAEAGVSGALTDTVQIRFHTTAVTRRTLTPVEEHQ